MMRALLLSFFAVFLCVSFAEAQEIKLRAGEHDGYSRLVFDLDGASSYDVKRVNASTVEISFPQGEAGSGLDKAAKNLLSVKKISDEPLTFHVQTFDDASFRNLKIGNRLVLDVYDVPGQERMERPEPQESDIKPKEEQLPQQPKEEPQTEVPGEPEDTKAEPEPVDKNNEETNEEQDAAAIEPEAEKLEEEEVEIDLELEKEPVTAEKTDEEKALEEQIQKSQEQGILKDKALPETPADIERKKAEEKAIEETKTIEEQAAAKAKASEEAKAEETGPNYKTVETPISPDSINAMLYAEPDAESRSKNNEPEDEQTASQVARSNLIAISSTEKFGMAVFEEAGRLWLVSDKAKILLNPEVTGPQKDYFLPLEEASVRGGTVMTTRAMEGANIKSRGGDLLWEIISTPEKVKYEPLEAKRKVNTELDEGGGIIIFPFEGASGVIDMKDPLTGSDLKVVTVIKSHEYAGPPREFVEFETLHSYAGLAIRPKVDNLEVRVTSRGVEITRKNGLMIMPPENLVAARTNAMKEKVIQDELDAGTYDASVAQRIFFFDVWELGNVGALSRNANIILAAMKDLTKAGRIEDMINLAKMHLANGRGAEALGFLRYAKTEMPRIAANPEFIALRGASNIFDSKIEAGYYDIMSPKLDNYPEIRLWRAAVFALLGDWNRAAKLMGDRFLPLYSYPSEIRNRLGVILAEIALRDGNVGRAETVFRVVEIDKDSLSSSSKAAMDYLKGEAARQKGDKEKTKELWEELTKGKDDLYRIKAGLALTIFLKQQEEIDTLEVIDRLERLRYAWRGDALESQVNFWLGRAYFENGEFIKGLRIMREAISFAKGTLLAKKIAAHMSDTFTDLFIGETLENVSPLDAVAIYEQFSELTPAGPDGDRVVAALVEHLVDADLLERAGDLLTYQINHRLNGDKAARAATRLAAIRLIDKKPDFALEALKRSNGILKTLPEIIVDRERYIENTLLRARALSQQGNPQDALQLLESLKKSPPVNRLRATIAWDAQYWDDAADALQDVLLDENVTGRRSVTDEQAMLVLNRAVALNLAGDRIALNNMRERFARAMGQTKRQRMFEVVTRERKNSGLADRETLMSITSEVDLFGDFLNSYRKEGVTSN